MMAPPRSAFTVDHRTAAPRRGKSRPLGRPDSAEGQFGSTAASSQTLHVIEMIIHTCDTAHVPWILENPANSLLWSTPRITSWAHLGHVTQAVSDMCAFGARWKRRTRFMCSRCAEDLCIPLDYKCRACGGKCSFAHGQHLQLRGRAPGGVSWTTISERYPPRLAHRLAHILVGPQRDAFINSSPFGGASASTD